MPKSTSSLQIVPVIFSTAKVPTAAMPNSTQEGPWGDVSRADLRWHRRRFLAKFFGASHGLVILLLRTLPTLLLSSEVRMITTYLTGSAVSTRSWHCVQTVLGTVVKKDEVQAATRESPCAERALPFEPA